jgi:alpha-galactosidase
MAAHVKRVQDMGMKYMLWYSVPFVGEHSQAYERFKGKFLGPSHGAFVLDPRFPEVREYLISTYERALREWNLDGFKLDFIDSFRVKGTDPAIAENYAGRDIKSVPEAVDVLMKGVLSRLQAIKPDILIEFRQNYIGPAIRQYGNMFRASDCPGDMQNNRIRIANLRLTSGTTAVHADMIEWNSAEKPEVAARHILSALYGVVQYSVMLRDIPKGQFDMVKHWIDFSQKHRKTLLHSDFRPYHPEACFPVLEAESKEERIITLYQEGMVVKAGSNDRDTYIINATGAERVAIELEGKPKKAEYYDTYGNLVAGVKLNKGLQNVNIPISGYVKLIY